MAEFGKLNFSVSFSPTTAFPLDARYYFESQASAEDAAKTADFAGSTSTTYYFGQQVVVVDKANKSVKLYIIKPNCDTGASACAAVLNSMAAANPVVKYLLNIAFTSVFVTIQ